GHPHRRYTHPLLKSIQAHPLQRDSLSITQALISVYDSPDFFLSHSPSVPISVQKQLGLPPSQEMKRFVAEVIAAKLSDEEISGLKQMFKMIDTDNSGYISFEELKDGLSSFGANLEESEIHDLMQAVILVSFLPSHQQEHQKPPKKSILEPIQAILPPPIAATSVFKQATERRQFYNLSPRHGEFHSVNLWYLVEQEIGVEGGGSERAALQINPPPTEFRLAPPPTKNGVGLFIFFNLRRE
ncbi:Calcium-binding EF-hand, partial [Cynara cardunculus var. scolymus]